jgi:hypothetical protein
MGRPPKRVWPTKKVFAVVYDARHCVDDVAYGMILLLKEQGFSNCDIAKKLGPVSVATVTRHLAAGTAPSCRARAEVLNRVSSEKQQEMALRSARAVVLLTTQKVVVKKAKLARSMLQQRVVSLPFGSLSRTGAKMKREGFLHTSRTTLQRDVKRAGLESRVRSRAPHLTPEQQQVRLEFCVKILRHVGGNKWDLVLFSDETWINCDDHGFYRQWVLPGEHPSQRYTHQFPRKVMIWVVVGIGFRLLVVHTCKATDPKAKHATLGRRPAGAVAEAKADYSVTAVVYIAKCLVPMKKKLVEAFGVAGAQTRFFVQDNASSHLAQQTTKWLTTNHIKQLPEKWPAHSPDLNMAENFWPELKRAVNERGPKNEQDLERFVVAEFDKVPQRNIDAYCRAFRGRLERCQELEGAYVTRALS